ncbi:MAG: PTS galactitol transporter subunit IIC, partial [Spirochaetales bacterium]|nr:PTS galactitol transporter subunit IIC [Spirochaetales bacterium]
VQISEGMKTFVAKKFPRLGPTFIGLDVAVMFATPSVMVSTVLLMPLALLLALVLPGVNFIPLGDLTNLLVPMALISAAVRGNLVRSLILGIPAIIANLYIATGLTALWPVLAKATHTHVAASSYTVFLDGGNFWRAWFLNLFSGGWIGWLFVPVGIVVLFVTWKLTRPGTLLGPEA